MANERRDDANGIGPMPTGGGARPGPVVPHPMTLPSGTHPVAIRLARLGLDTQVEEGDLVDGAPSNPSTPWVAVWYRTSGLLGLPGVALVGGLTTIEDEGPAAFARLAEAKAGDTVELTGKTGGLFRYRIDSVVPQASPTALSDLLAATTEERIALLGWDGVFPSPISGDTIVVATGVRERG